LHKAATKNQCHVAPLSLICSPIHRERETHTHTDAGRGSAVGLGYGELEDIGSWKTYVVAGHKALRDLVRHKMGESVEDEGTLALGGRHEFGWLPRGKKQCVCLVTQEGAVVGDQNGAHHAGAVPNVKVHVVSTHVQHVSATPQDTWMSASRYASHTPMHLKTTRCETCDGASTHGIGTCSTHAMAYPLGIPTCAMA